MRVESSSVARVLFLISLGAALLVFVHFEWKLLLLSFAGLLVAVLLNVVTEWVQLRTGLRHTLAYLLTLAAIAAVVSGVLLFIVPRAITQFSELAVVFPHALRQATNSLEHHAWGQSLLDLFHSARRGMSIGSKVPQGTEGVLSGAVDLVIILVIGLFGALSPEAYKQGMLLLLPSRYRARARSIGTEVARQLSWWLLGQMVPMLALGIASMLALWVLGVHLAFLLGLFTGLMVFVPYAGSKLSGVPAVLISLERGPRAALTVLVLYLVFHLAEGYLLSPLIQRRAVRLPPIVTVLSQFFMWSFAGLLGVAVAAPIAAATLVLVREFYLKPSAERDDRESATLVP